MKKKSPREDCAPPRQDCDYPFLAHPCFRGTVYGFSENADRDFLRGLKKFFSCGFVFFIVVTFILFVLGNLMRLLDAIASKL